MLECIKFNSTELLLAALAPHHNWFLQKALVELDLFNQAQIWDSLLKHPDTAHGNIRANNIATRFKESQHNA
jgi:hypothetical protein